MLPQTTKPAAHDHGGFRESVLLGSKNSLDNSNHAQAAQRLQPSAMALIAAAKQALRSDSRGASGWAAEALARHLAAQAKVVEVAR